MNQTLIDLADEQTHHNSTQINANNINQQLNQTQTLLNAYESYLAGELKINDLNALPTLPTGKSLTDLIDHVCQPCPHGDYDNLQTQLNNKDQKIKELEEQLQEKDRIIVELQNKPPVSPVNDREPETTEIRSIVGDQKESLLTIINQQQATIKELQTQIGKPEIKEIIKEVLVKDLAVIQGLQEKIKSKDQLLTQWRYFCLVSLGVSVLLLLNTVKLLVKKKTKR